MLIRMIDVVRAIDPAASGLNEMLTELVVGAVRIFPEVDHAGVSTTFRDGRVQTRASSDGVPIRLDQLQEELNEGPSHDLSVDSRPIIIQNAGHAERWPNYLAAATAMGLRAQLTLRLFISNYSLGNLNLYCTSNDVIGEDTIAMAKVYAGHVATLLGRTQVRLT